MSTSLRPAKITLPSKSYSFGEHLPVLSLGRIVDAFPAVRMYAVEVLGKICLCGPATPGFRMFPSGTSVIVAHPQGDLRAYVIASITSVLGSLDVEAGNLIVPGKGVDVFQSAAHRFHLEQTDASGMDNFNVFQPLDICPGSDFGEIAETGVGYGGSRFFSFLRASDVCGVWAFNIDNLLRTAGFNRDDWSSAWERLTRNDEGTLTDEEYLAIFPWESSGMRTKTEPFEESATGGMLQPGQLDTWFMPKEVGQISIPRVTSLRGKYGAGVLRVVSVPEKDKVPDVETRASSSRHTGLVEVRETLDGFFGVKAARGFMFEKTSNILVPKRMARHEDSKGDSGESELAQRAFPGAGRTPVEALAEASDMLAYRASKGDVNALKARDKDYYLPLNSRVGEETPSAVPDFKSMAGSLPLPQVVPVTPEEGGDQFEVYRSRAYFGATPDGGFIMSDGYGSIFAMTGGNIYMSPVGDIFQLPGRNHVVMAGRDAIVRAAKSVDVSTDYGDIRLLAERNLHALSGNSGKEGSLILENRATVLEKKMVDGDGEKSKAGGIYFKSETIISSKSKRDTVIQSDARTVIAAAADVHLKSEFVNVAADSRFQVKSGGSELHVDTGVVRLRGGYFRNEAAYTRHAGAVTFNSSLLVGGSVAALGGLGTPTGEEAKEIRDKMEKEVKRDEKADDATDTQDKKREKSFTDRGLPALEPLLEKGRPSAKAWEKIQVSARSSSEYGTAGGFVILRAPWQQLLSSSGVETGALTLPRIQGEKATAAYPGTDAEKLKAVVTMPSQFLSPETGDYTGGEPATKVDSAPLSSYVTLTNPEKVYGR